jgi:hypothetical protein
VAEEMADVSDYLTKLEQIGILEAAILRTTKIHKVMKYLQKMEPDSIPRESEFQFISRSRALWSLYQQILAQDADGTAIAAALDTKLVINDHAADTSNIEVMIPAAAQPPIVPPPDSGEESATSMAVASNEGR